MAAVTTTILLGESHPNEVSVNPSVLLKLWEGDHASWTAHHLDDKAFDRRRDPQSPADIAATGCELARELAEEFGLDSAIVVILPSSSLNGAGEELGHLLADLQLHVVESVGSRTRAQWSNEWATSGCLNLP